MYFEVVFHIDDEDHYVLIKCDSLERCHEICQDIIISNNGYDIINSFNG